MPVPAVAERLTNELGNDILVVATRAPADVATVATEITLTVTGPKSTAHNVMTVSEAKTVRDVLTALLGPTPRLT